jgi:hypothetical protein
MSRGAKAQVTIGVIVKGTPRYAKNSATASAITVDPQPANNTDTETTQVISG